MWFSSYASGQTNRQKNKKQKFITTLRTPSPGGKETELDIRGCYTWHTLVDDFQVFAGVGTRIGAGERCIVHCQRTARPAVTPENT